MTRSSLDRRVWRLGSYRGRRLVSAHRSTRRRQMGHVVNLSRRQLLGGGLAGASIMLGACGGGSGSVSSTTAARRALRAPGSRPRPDRPVGTDQVPKIEHIVVVMMENHSFDNILGLIGRGDGFTVGHNHRPTATNPDGQGNLVHAFHMPTECQTKRRRKRLEGHPRGVRQRDVPGLRHQHLGRGDGLLHRVPTFPSRAGWRRPSPSPIATSVRPWRRPIRTAGT